MNISYASFDEIAQEASIAPDSTGALYATHKREILQFGQRVTNRVDQHSKLTFAPYYQTRYIDAWGDDVIGWRLNLDYPLLALSAVTMGDGTALVVDTDVRLYPRHGSPGWWLQLLDSSTLWRDATDSLDHDIAVTGYWGWHSDYTNAAWFNSGDTIGEALDASETSIETTGEVSGTGGDGFTPRFSPGNLIRIESEYMAVIDTTSNTAPTLDTLTVLRGVRGTTAATHVITTPIYVYKPDLAITRATMLIAMFNYERRGKWEQVSFDGIQTRATVEIPPEALDILDGYRIVEFG